MGKIQVRGPCCKPNTRIRKHRPPYPNEVHSRKPTPTAGWRIQFRHSQPTAHESQGHELFQDFPAQALGGTLTVSRNLCKKPLASADRKFARDPGLQLKALGLPKLHLLQDMAALLRKERGSDGNGPYHLASVRFSPSRRLHKPRMSPCVKPDKAPCSSKLSGSRWERGGDAHCNKNVPLQLMGLQQVPQEILTKINCLHTRSFVKAAVSARDSSSDTIKFSRLL